MSDTIKRHRFTSLNIPFNIYSINKLFIHVLKIDCRFTCFFPQKWSRPADNLFILIFFLFYFCTFLNIYLFFDRVEELPMLAAWVFFLSVLKVNERFCRMFLKIMIVRESSIQFNSALSTFLYAILSSFRYILLVNPAEMFRLKNCYEFRNI